MHYHVFDLTLVYLPYQLFSFDVNSCNTWHFHLVCERKVDFWKFQNTLTDCRCRKADTSFWSRCDLSNHQPGHGLQTPGEEIAFTARPKINSDSQIFRYGRSIILSAHQPKFSDFFDLFLHWVFRSPWTRSQPTQPAAHSRFCFQFSRKLDSRETTKVRNVLLVEFQFFYIKVVTRIKLLIWLCAEFLVFRASFQNL